MRWSIYGLAAYLTYAPLRKLLSFTAPLLLHKARSFDPCYSSAQRFCEGCYNMDVIISVRGLPDPGVGSHADSVMLFRNIRSKEFIWKQPTATMPSWLDASSLLLALPFCAFIERSGSSWWSRCRGARLIIFDHCVIHSLLTRKGERDYCHDIALQEKLLCRLPKMWREMCPHLIGWWRCRSDSKAKRKVFSTVL